MFQMGYYCLYILQEPNLIPLTEVNVEEVKRGLELGKTLELPTFNALLMAKLLIPLPDTSLRQFTHLRFVAYHACIRLFVVM